MFCFMFFECFYAGKNVLYALTFSSILLTAQSSIKMSIDLDDLSRMLEKTGVKAKIKTDGVTAKVVIPDNRPEVNL